jgi:hypothetical protein
VYAALHVIGVSIDLSRAPCGQHKGQVAELTTQGLQHLLTLALEYAEAQGAPVGDSYESTWAAAPPQHLSALERLLEEPQGARTLRLPGPQSHPLTPTP